MKRKEFMSAALKTGACCGAAMLLQGGNALARMAAPKPNQAGTPNEKKIAFAHRWIKRFMDILDSQLDEDARKKLMESNGRACYCGAHGEFDPSSPQPDLDQWIASRQKELGSANLWREGNAVYFNYVQNRQGLKVSDGYCLCPLVEDGPLDLSVTYCLCSVGYVREIFQRIVRKPLEVELLASIHRGDSGCRFKVILKG